MHTRTNFYIFAFIVLFIVLENPVFSIEGAEIAIYTGTGSWEDGIVAFENFLNWKGISHERIGPYEVNFYDLKNYYDAILFPGGDAYYYKMAVNQRGISHIKDLVNNGGAYIGICAGAYFASDSVVWEGVIYNYPLDLFDGITSGAIDEIAPWPDYVMSTINMNMGNPINKYESSTEVTLYYGGPIFQPHQNATVDTVATWAAYNNECAIINFTYGDGRVLLLGPHPEIEEDSERDGTTFANELEDEGSEWNFLWAAIDWALNRPISSPPKVNDLRASVIGENILLEWTAADGITTYNVYRGTVYDFVPDIAGGTNRIAASITDEDAGTAGVQWTDTGNGADVVGDVETNYFYKVTAVSSEEFDPSNLAGEFDYRLVTTEGTNINHLAVLMHTQNTRTPILTAEDLAQAIPYCTDVYKWDAEGQGSVGHVKGVGFNNFDINPGYPYSVNVTSDTIWTVAGSYSDTSFNLITTDGTNINHLAVPLSKGHLTTAEELGQDIPNCTDVYYWDAQAQGTIGHVVGVGFENFSVRGGYPYKVNVTENIVWPSEGGEASATVSVNSTENALPEGLLSGNIPHTVYGKLVLSEDDNIDINKIKLRAWIVGRSDEFLTEAQPGTGCDGKYWWVSVSNFASNWKISDSLIVEIINSENGLRGQTLVVLTDAGSDQGENIRLSAITSIAGINLKEMPKKFALLQNYPNPFNPDTRMSYGLPKAAHVTIQIYDISGRLVRTLVDRSMSAGYHQETWDGRNSHGQLVSSGLYFCKMKAADYQKTIKLLFAK